MWEAVGRIADVASLAALIVTSYNTWQIGRLKRRLVFNARADQILREIAKSIRGIKTRVQDHKYGGRDFEIELKQCLENAYRVRGVLSPDIRKRLGRLRELERNFDQTTGGQRASENPKEIEDILWQIIKELSIFMSDVRAMLADRRVGGGGDE
ncbi:MAG: hypothetical protein GC191_09775 [Azospirillum sp.]|nr:hypothetical protein [Azospirillum sp.]